MDHMPKTTLYWMKIQQTKVQIGPMPSTRHTSGKAPLIPLHAHIGWNSLAIQKRIHLPFWKPTIWEEHDTNRLLPDRHGPNEQGDVNNFIRHNGHCLQCIKEYFPSSTLGLQCPRWYRWLWTSYSRLKYFFWPYGLSLDCVAIHFNVRTPFVMIGKLDTVWCNSWY